MYNMCKCLVIVFVSLFVSAESLIITTDQGKLNGTYGTTRSGKKFNAFYGISFAQPPVGVLRFKPPREAEPWTGILNATSGVSTGCIQISESTSKLEGSEDCLYLNVYSPLHAREGDNLSVIVFIFGGRYKGNTNMDFGPQYILERDVVLVIPNYRLGVLGFMTTGDTVIPGNFQLKDQTMALKWVQKNIRRFGGNPNDVTLEGHSSGAACAHLHTLSPASKGLFHKVILQSGTYRDGFFDTEVMQRVAKEFATKAACPDTSSSKSMLACFMALNASVFPSIGQTMHLWDLAPHATFKPCIEDVNSEDAFITGIPTAADYHTPSAPWIIGITTGEAAFLASRFLSNGGKLAAELDQYYKLLFPITLDYFWNTKKSHLNYVSKMLRMHYFGNREIDAETSHQMTEMYTHGKYGIGTIEIIRRYPGPKYVYWFDYRANYSTQNVAGNYEEYLGVSHGTEVALIYNCEPLVGALTNRDRMFSEELVNRWVNFAQTGNPNQPVRVNRDIMSDWRPMVTDRIEYLRIKLNGSMETDLYKGTYDFWMSLPMNDEYDWLR